MTRYPVVGSANSELMIDRVSSGVVELIGEPADQVLGRTLLEIVEVADVADLLGLLGQRRPNRRAARLPARLRGRTALSPPGDLVVVPMLPSASCVFAWVGAAERTDREFVRVLAQLLAAPEPAPDDEAARVTAVVRGMERLTAREADIVSRLVAGDRVPTIARSLFLSQSTVRNRLSVIYRKLGVTSQQGLIDLVRQRGRIV